MLMSNLAVLLAERRLRISRVATDTGISRTTLTALSQNDFKGVQVDTMNTLCQYLNVTIGQFFEFVPFDLSFSLDTSDATYNKEPDRKTPVDKITIEKFDLDAFLKKRSLSEISGRVEKTFDLTVRLGEDVTIYNRYDKESDKKIKIPIQIFLGHASDSETFKEQHNEFLTIWNEKLNQGFQSLVANDIYREIKENISSVVKDLVLNNSDVVPNWDLLSYTFSIHLENAYTKEPSNHLNILFSGDDLPF